MTEQGNDGREVDLRADGLLWLINRVVFHPRGYALGIDESTGKFSLYGDGSELFEFRLPEGEEDQWFEAASAVLSRSDLRKNS